MGDGKNIRYIVITSIIQIVLLKFELKKWVDTFTAYF